MEIIKEFNNKGFVIAKEKIQKMPPYMYLGHKIMTAYASPVIPKLPEMDKCTLVQLQQYLGSINWARPYMGLTTGQVQPLFALLAGGKEPATVLTIGEKERQCIQLIQTAMTKRWVDRMIPQVPLSAAIFNTENLPTGCLLQIQQKKAFVVEWIHLANTPKRTVSTKPLLLSQIILKIRERTRAVIGMDPITIYVPYPLPWWEKYFQISDELQLALSDYVGAIKYHLPTDYRFLLLNQQHLQLISLQSKMPIKGAVTVFANGTKNRGACVYQIQGQWVVYHTTPQSSAQRSELAASILAFEKLKDQEFNLIVDSLYVFQIINDLFDAYLSPVLDKQLLSMFVQLQQLIMDRKCQYFLAHIRSHQSLPGILTEGNYYADKATREGFIAFVTPWESHEYFHQNAKALMKMFKISKMEATAIIQQCPTCNKQGASIPMGVNPRGINRCEIWQMDVTQYPPFAPWKYIHVTVDTFSGFIFATPQRGETTKQVINHCMRSFSVLGSPLEIKTDNGPAYSSAAFATFCDQWKIVHKFGIPYNSQGQGIVERANLTLKMMLEKQQDPFKIGLPEIQNRLSKALYTQNFLNLTGSPIASTAADRHFRNSVVSPRPLVYYRQLPDPQWKGPVELVTWGRGYAAVQLPDKVLWVPGRCIRPFHEKSVETDNKKDPEASLSLLFQATDYNWLLWPMCWFCLCPCEACCCFHCPYCVLCNLCKIPCDIVIIEQCLQEHFFLYQSIPYRPSPYTNSATGH
ncbi:PREDICTED: endogenous retrovirus group K member 11 Pol protein-like [Thamnophis sirtalis]|uniref:RNA-directed DNA polymerase n=1 Tax=Thamnophis sirtalis TaxID=35019 RepID=A0A6I9Y1A4_9SAUR|nr:PREDICTED: endogenous retrovirus group K member 11 Pol protein-like [Thamnophis sirtalis]